MINRHSQLQVAGYELPARPGQAGVLSVWLAQQVPSTHNA